MGGGKISIGNNCFIGYNTVILKNTEIGDNCIIGARSVVKGNIPSGTVWAGVPAKMICTIAEFYERRKKNRLNEALYRRDFIIEKYHHSPSIEEMGLFSYLFLERSEDNYNKYIKNIEFNGIEDRKDIKYFFFNSVPVFSSFEDFLKFHL